MMKRGLMFLMALTLLVTASQGFAQARKGQIELYGGLGIPLGPDVFKDYYKMGFSGHGQYVVFPSPKLGISFGVAYERFSFDGDKFLADLDLTGSGLTVEGSASVVEFGVGLRPYLTQPEASTQFFLFGMGTYNLLKDEATVSFEGEQLFSGKDDFNKFGVAAGAGLELPAGESLNIILQGLFRFIFTESETDPDTGESVGGTTSFVGVTAGIVF